MGSSAAPNPDPYGFIAAKAASDTATNNLAAAGAATDANRVNQYTPYGSLTYDKTNNFNSTQYNSDVAAYQNQVKGIQDGTDNSAAAQYYRASGTLPVDAHLNSSDPRYNQVVWNSTTTLTPAAQAALTSQQNVDLGRSQAAEAEITKMKAFYGTDFVAPNATDYSNKAGAVNQSNVGTLGNYQSNAAINTNAAGAVAGVNPVNQNVGAYDPSQANVYAQKAYDSQMALLQPGMDQATQKQNNGLALQGLNPGTQASNNAQSQLQLSQAAQKNSLAASSYQLGNDSARNDYATRLAGIAAGNAAQGQAYGQAANTFALGNTAQSQQSALDLSKYGANIDQLKTNSALQAAQNAAQAQSYQQQMNNYTAATQAAYAQRDQPVNEMNALLNQQQIGMPTFGNYATQQTTGGADATSAYNSWLTGTNASNNARQAASSANTGAAAGVVGAGLGAYGAAVGAGALAF